MPFKDPERQRAYRQAYYQANKESHNARGRAWYARNKEWHRAKLKAYREKNRTAWLRRMKNYNIWNSYGLTPQDRVALFESSDGLCALCYEEPAMVIDHDHETGEVRGALCRPCNTGLGWIEKMGATSSAIEEYLATDWRAG